MHDTRKKMGERPELEASQTESSGPGLTAPPSISLPKGGGAIRGMGEKFAANPVTGTGSMSVPIAISAGRAGFGPQLSLSYDSGSGNGPFGLGWNLSLPAITRKTDKGLPQYFDAEESDVFILSGAEDLVPVLDANRQPAQSPAAAANLNYRIKLYRPRIEGLFARIERWTRVSNPRDVHWRSISKDNILTLYGSDADSRIVDPEDASRIFSWLICETRDDKGNGVLYRYKAEDGLGVDLGRANERNRGARNDARRTANRYLKHIYYGNRSPLLDNAGQRPRFLTAAQIQNAGWMFEVVLDYGEHQADAPVPGDAGQWTYRDDPFSTYRAGFEVRTTRLCQRVLMFHHFPDELGTNDCLVRATHFTYRQAPIASFITSATQSGYIRKPDGTYLKKSLPPLEFEYSEANIDETVRDVDASSLENLPYGLDGARYQWVDLDGEGLSGILTEQGGGWFYKRNLSALPVVGSDGKPKVAARFAPVECLRTMPSPANLAGGQQLLDLVGDGQLDVVEFDGPVPGFFERTTDEGWNTFRSFASLPNVAWKDPNLKFVDLTGDGHADILITEDEVLTWYPSLAEEGFGAAEKVRQTFDEETGPRLVFADGTQSIYLSDLSGDGLTDLVRIRNGEVCYWPNLGYGRFGAKVTMDNAPWFDTPDQFDQKRIRLADIDGSGTIDILYLGADGVYLYFNRSGNSWSPARKLGNFPRTDNLSSVMTADLLGNGTACLVWSSPLPGDARRPMRYIDLMGGQKPHLLIKTVNNLGAETRVHYAPSTKFYLADKYAGRPWITKLPFPVHVVEKVTVKDKWRKTEFASTYSYHHGYFDGIEREFRGFGRVEQIDVEKFDKFSSGNAASPYITDDHTLYQPPVKSVTWFHAGAFFDGERILSHFSSEYFPKWLEALRPDEINVLGEFLENDLPEPDLYAQDLSAEEWREALRACKGMILRQEVYELDVDALHLRDEQLPVKLFSTAYHNCHIRRLQPKMENRHAVFLVTESEAITYNYELDLRQSVVKPDPRIAHTLNLRIDEFGNILQSAAVVYPRIERYIDTTLSQADRGLIDRVQHEQHLAYTETHYTDDVIDDADNYRLPVACEVLTYELTGIIPEDADDITTPDLRDNLYFTLDELQRYRLSDRHQSAGVAVTEIPYHQRPKRPTQTNPAPPEKRLVENVRMLFFKESLSDVDPRPFRQQGRLGLPYETYKLALTRDLLTRVLGTKLTTGLLLTVKNEKISGYLSGAKLAARLSRPTTTDEYWIRSGTAGFESDAAQHFYLPERYTDPFDNVTTLKYDPRDLFIQSSQDVLGNTTSIALDDQTHEPRFDYRVLAPIEMVDINGNHTEVYFDLLGMVVVSAVKGKQVNGQWEGDNLDDYTDALANPSATDVVSFCTSATLNDTQARTWLGNASARFVYHFGERIATSGQIVWNDRMAGACGIVRERHASQVALDPLHKNPLQVALECSDGGGNVIMKKVQAEPDPASTATHPPLRWIINGLTVLNNKGKPVKQYEPAFSDKFGCELPQANGVSTTTYYDAPGRVVRIEMPDGTFSRVEFSPWHVLSYDPNDTAYDPDSTKRSDWYNRRTNPTHPRFVEFNNAEDRRAADLVEMHANTPAVMFLDSLGRNVVSVAHNNFRDSQGTLHDEKYLTFTKLDAEGKPLWIRDARGNLVMQYINPPKQTRLVDTPQDPHNPTDTTREYVPDGSAPCYDIAGNLLFQHSMDAGDRWMLMDAAGKPMLAWDLNERQEDDNSFVGEQRIYLTKYDQLHRPIEMWLYVDGGGGQMVERFEYQDAVPLDTDNLNGQLVRHYDPSGLIETKRRDFKGNVPEVRRTLVRDARASRIDWQNKFNPDGSSKLEAETYSQINEFDALNRMTRMYNWHRGVGSRVAVHEPVYNERGVLKSETLRVRGVKTAGGVDQTGSRLENAILNIQYNVKGQKEYLALGNGTLTQYDYDTETFRLKQLRTTRPADGGNFPSRRSNLSDSHIVQQLLYTYDPVGNITEIVDEAYEPVFFQNQQVEPRSKYEYDALYRLIRAAGRENGALRGAPTIPEGTSPEAQFPIQGGDPNALRIYTQTYRYDQVGNIERMHHEAGLGTWTRRFRCADDSNRLLATWDTNDEWSVVNSTEVTPYQYDTHGNMLNLVRTDPRFNMRWDHRDMIHNIDLGGGGRAYYQYDSGKQRTRKRIEKQNHSTGHWERIYLGGYELYRRYNGANPTTPVEEIESNHLFEGEQRILLVDDVITASVTGSPRPDGLEVTAQTLFRYQYSNHLGSACLELNDQAEIISYEEYHPYGTSAYRAKNGSIEAPPKRYRYTGMERDEESGLNYHAARYCPPWLGRWVSADPIGIKGGLNLYAGVNSNPIRYRDRSGHAADDLKAVLGDIKKYGDQLARGADKIAEHVMPHKLIEYVTKIDPNDTSEKAAYLRQYMSGLITEKDYGKAVTIVWEKFAASLKTYGKGDLAHLRDVRDLLKSKSPIDAFREIQHAAENAMSALGASGTVVSPSAYRKALAEQMAGYAGKSHFRLAAAEFFVRKSEELAQLAGKAMSSKTVTKLVGAAKHIPGTKIVKVVAVSATAYSLAGTAQAAEKGLDAAGQGDYNLAATNLGTAGLDVVELTPTPAGLLVGAARTGYGVGDALGEGLGVGEKAQKGGDDVQHSLLWLGASPETARMFGAVGSSLAGVSDFGNLIMNPGAMNQRITEEFTKWLNH